MLKDHKGQNHADDGHQIGRKRKAKGNLGDIKVHIDRGNVKDLILMDQKGRTSPKKLRRFKEVSQKTADDGTGRKKQEEPEAILGTKSHISFPPFLPEACLPYSIL